jgi:hypothetical protein
MRSLLTQPNYVFFHEDQQFHTDLQTHRYPAAELRLELLLLALPLEVERPSVADVLSAVALLLEVVVQMEVYVAMLPSQLHLLLQFFL